MSRGRFDVKDDCVRSIKIMGGKVLEVRGNGGGGVEVVGGNKGHSLKKDIPLKRNFFVCFRKILAGVFTKD